MSTASHFCRLVIAAAVFSWVSISSVTMAGQSSALHGPLGMVSDWSHHHLLYSAPDDASVKPPVRRDPRWRQNWYISHPEAWWPGFNRRHGRRMGRDWSVPLGTAFFEPLFDGTFSFVIGTESGSGSLSTTSIGGGELLATTGTLNVTAGNDQGTYGLYPGGPTAIDSPAGGFIYDNLLYPTAAQVLDVDGLLFTNSSGFEINIWGNSATNYEFDDTGYANDNTGFPFTLNVNASPDPGGGVSYPAKFAFDVTAAPSCASDYAVIGIATAPAAAGQANIVGLNNLYSAPDGSGFCPTAGPTVMFAYASGTGQVPGSLVLSQNGQQVAYIENLAGSSYFHILTIGTTGSNGSSAMAAAVPGTGNNAADQRVLLSPDGGTTNQSSTNSPYVVYTHDDSNDVAYVTTYSMAGSGSGYLYKISNVFNGSTAPTIVWSVAIDAIPSTPVYDQTSNKVFFTDSGGRIDYVVDSGASPSVVYSGVLASGSTSENPVIVDSNGQMVYAFFNSDGTNAIVVQAPTSMATSVSAPVGTGNTTYTGPYLGAFNHAWFSGSGAPLMYVAGTGTGTTPTLYSIGFTGGVMNSTPTASTPLATGSADSSPVTEFYNATLARDFLFVGVSDNCIAIAGGGSAGCVMSLDITSGFPTVNAGSTALAAAGGTGGMIVDNDSVAAEAASIYYVTRTGETIVKATQSGLQ